MERKTAFRIAAHLANGDNEKFMRMVKVCIVSGDIIEKKEVTDRVSRMLFEGKLLRVEKQLKRMEESRNVGKID